MDRRRFKIFAPRISTNREPYYSKSNYAIIEELRKFRKMDAYCTADPKMAEVEEFSSIITTACSKKGDIMWIEIILGQGLFRKFNLRNQNTDHMRNN